jgi:hypothetical protein
VLVVLGVRIEHRSTSSRVVRVGRATIAAETDHVEHSHELVRAELCLFAASVTFVEQKLPRLGTMFEHLDDGVFSVESVNPAGLDNFHFAAKDVALPK